MRSAPFGEADQVSYRGRRIGLLTQHGKERVISPELDRALGCRVERVGGYDTDLLGTFTRDVPRAGTQLEAARKKARIGMERSGLPLGLASEGSFGRIRSPGMIPWNVELVILIDDEQVLEIIGVAQGGRTSPTCSRPPGRRLSCSPTAGASRSTSWCCAPRAGTIPASARESLPGRTWRPSSPRFRCSRAADTSSLRPTCAPMQIPPAWRTSGTQPRT